MRGRTGRTLMNDRRPHLLTVPAWIPLSISLGLGLFVVSRGLDYLDPSGNKAPYLDGLNAFGFHRWGVALVALGAVLAVCSLLRLARKTLPLFAAHLGCVFAYGVLFVAVATADPSWTWCRALMNIAAAALMHVARAVSLFFERATEQMDGGARE